MSARRPAVPTALGVLVLVALAGVAAWLGWRRAGAVPDLARWDPLIERTAQAFALDADLLRALVAVESGGRPAAVSRRGAVGLCQLMPATAREQARRLGMGDYADERLADPEVNVRLGAAYFARLLERFHGEVAFAAAAYNAGATRVLRWRARAPDVSAEAVVWREGFAETRRHLQRLLRYRRAYAAR